MIKVTLWNESKLSMYDDSQCNPSKYEALTEHEERTETNLSSIIQVNDMEQLESIIEAVYNETDVKLCYHVHGGDKGKDKRDNLKLLLSCLMDTAKRHTDLTYIYNDETNQSISFGMAESIIENI